MKGKTALITGGCGLIGSTIADQLLDAGAARVVLLDNLTRGTRYNVEHALASGKAELAVLDIRDAKAIRPLFDGVDVVFHQAAIRITTCAEKPRECLEVLIDGTFNVLEACIDAKVPRVVAASTASIYGGADVFPTTELHHPYNNRTWYGAAKVANEGMLRSFADMYGLSYVALRYFNVYGPRMDVFGKYTEVLIRWLECLDRGERPKIFGDGSTSMDFVFSEDIARANLLAASSDATDEVFNVASGTETTLLEMFHALMRAAGRPDVEPEFLPPRGVNAVPRRLASTEKTERLLGFRTTVGLEEGLRRVVEWRKEVLAKHQWQAYA